MKAICVVTCALAASATVASAASIEQVFDINVSGVYQGVPTVTRTAEHDRVQVFSITSANIVRALAIDYDTNYFTGSLFFKTAVDGGTNSIVIRQRGKTNELDVTTNFTFVVSPNFIP